MYSDIKIKILPRSSRDELIGREGDIYKVKVTAPPVDGKANRALISLLSKKLGTAKSYIEITSGRNSRMKQIRIYGLSMKDINNLLEGV